MLNPEPSEEALIAGILAELESHLDGAVSNGRITQDEADTKLANAGERLAEAVNKVRGDEAAAATGTSL